MFGVVNVRRAKLARSIHVCVRALFAAVALLLLWGGCSAPPDPLPGDGEIPVAIAALGEDVRTKSRLERTVMPELVGEHFAVMQPLRGNSRSIAVAVPQRASGPSFLEDASKDGH